MSLWGILFCPTCVIILIEILNPYNFITVYLQESKIAKRIPAINRIGPHNKDILCIINGSLLGDRHREIRIQGKGTRISFNQSAGHKEYLLWLHKTVSNLGYCSSYVPAINTSLTANGVIKSQIRFNTYTYSSFNDLHKAWYLNGIKRVPLNIGEYLTPLALAIWIIDDGGRVGYGLKLSTNSFTFLDCLRLTEVLYTKYNIKSSVQTRGAPNQYILYIWSRSIPDLRVLVRPFIVSSMLYKLGE